MADSCAPPQTQRALKVYGAASVGSNEIMEQAVRVLVYSAFRCARLALADRIIEAAWPGAAVGTLAYASPQSSRTSYGLVAHTNRPCACLSVA
jgi:hypothetical protein